MEERELISKKIFFSKNIGFILGVLAPIIFILISITHNGSNTNIFILIFFIIFLLCYLGYKNYEFSLVSGLILAIPSGILLVIGIPINATANHEMDSLNYYLITSLIILFIASLFVIRRFYLMNEYLSLYVFKKNSVDNSKEINNKIEIKPDVTFNSWYDDEDEDEDEDEFEDEDDEESEDELEIKFLVENLAPSTGRRLIRISIRLQLLVSVAFSLIILNPFETDEQSNINPFAVSLFLFIVFLPFFSFLYGRTKNIPDSMGWNIFFLVHSILAIFTLVSIIQLIGTIIAINENKALMIADNIFSKEDLNPQYVKSREFSQSMKNLNQIYSDGLINSNEYQKAKEKLINKLQ